MGFGVNDEILYRMTVVCKCKIGELSFNNLGMPLGANPRKVATWNEIVERFKGKLSSLKWRSLSWATRVVLINSILSSLPIYFMSIFQMPMTMIKRIDKIRRSLLWGSVNGKRKMARVSWK